MDLSEWLGHRILARRDDFFCPGIIKAAYKDNSLAVDFESEETPLIYSNVLSRGDFDTIISDSVPATNQITVGSKVALKIPDDNLYTEALVYEIKTKEGTLSLPPQFLVKPLHDDDAEKVWVKRTQLVRNTQCENFSIFLSIRFYVKSISENLKVLDLPFLGL